MANETENETGNGKSDGLILSDPMGRPKKWAVSLLVTCMVVAMVLSFASFHWLYTEYFNFAANEENFKQRSKELDEELARKKQDVAVLIKGFKERFESATNELVMAMQSQEADLQRLKIEKDSLVDVARQYESVSNALVRAQDARDNAMRLEREAQDAFNEWNGRIGVAKSEVAQLEAQRMSLRKELQSLESLTNNASVNLSVLHNEERIEKDRLSALASELQAVSNRLHSANATLADLRTSIGNATTEAKGAEKTRDEAVKAREATEAARDKAQGERDVAETALRQIKRELETMVNATNDAAVALGRINGVIEMQNATIQSSRIELQSISNRIDLANLRLAEIVRQSETADGDRKRAVQEKAQYEKERNAALDSKREAESLRDKAVAERELAEKRLNERKPEIETQLTELEMKLESMRKRVETAKVESDGKPTKEENGK